MHSKKDILKNLSDFNYFIDEQILDNFIKNWKIDPIYEDEDGIEYYDSFTIAKIKKGISLKSQGFDNEQIIYHINRLLQDRDEKRASKISRPMALSNVSAGSEMKNFTVDVTGQTLQMLADAVAQKISNDIKDQVQTTLSIGDGATLRKDNEALAKQVEELLLDNKRLAKRVEELEQKKKSLWGLWN